MSVDLHWGPVCIAYVVSSTPHSVISFLMWFTPMGLQTVDGTVSLLKEPAPGQCLLSYSNIIFISRSPFLTHLPFSILSRSFLFFMPYLTHEISKNYIHYGNENALSDLWEFSPSCMPILGAPMPSYYAQDPRSLTARYRPVKCKPWL